MLDLYSVMFVQHASWCPINPTLYVVTFILMLLV